MSLRTYTTVCAITLAIPLALGCERFQKVSKLAGSVGSASCSELESGDFSRLAIGGSSQTRLKITGFLSAVHQLNSEIQQVHTDLTDFCYHVSRTTGTSKKQAQALKSGERKKKQKSGLGALIDELPEGDDAKVKRLCSQAVAGFKNARVSVHVSLTPPVCTTNLDALSQCLTDCGAPVEAGALKASCKGSISGTCDGQCKGECEGTATTACEGTCGAECDGHCEGSFTGQCQGVCEGTCDGEESSGNCAGVCQGQCAGDARGTCAGTCAGACSGECEHNAKASCDGKCSGECSGEFTNLGCQGEFQPPKVDPSCQAACATQASSALQCTPVSGQVEVVGGNAELSARLKESLPLIVDLMTNRSQRLLTHAEQVISAAADLEGLSDAGSDALVCITAGATVATSAVGGLKGSLQASADLSVMGGGTF